MKKYSVSVTFHFILETDADGIGEAQWDASRYIADHILDDEDLTPIEWVDSTFIAI